MDGTLSLLNQEPKAARLKNLGQVGSGGIPSKFQDINNHIHTSFSFSPYSPTAAIYLAQRAGLHTAGIVDHDSMAGAEEFTDAGEQLGMPTTAGVELRVSLAGTSFERHLINNPDQKGCIYMALHAVPRKAYATIQAALEPYRLARNQRNMRMVDKANATLPQTLALSFQEDVLPLSQWHAGGSVTERHISMALAQKILTLYSDSQSRIQFLTQELGLPLNPTLTQQLTAEQNPYLAYDLLGLVKSHLLSRFYLPAEDELMPLTEALALSEQVQAISAYAYLGDVTQSITGDKRAQSFEDSFLDEWFDFIVRVGFRAVTYMPSRNTPDQLRRVSALCRTHSLLEISGEDINSPRQPFVCTAQRAPEFAHLYDAAWALIAHERRVNRHAEDGFFGEKAIKAFPQLQDRVRQFAEYGRKELNFHETDRLEG